MSNFFRITSTCWTAGGYEADTELCEHITDDNEGLKFSQYFERAWTTKLFDNLDQCIEALNKIYSDKKIFVSYTTEKSLLHYKPRYEVFFISDDEFTKSKNEIYKTSILIHEYGSKDQE